MMRLMYQFRAATCSSMLEALLLVVVLFLSPKNLVRPKTFGPYYVYVHTHTHTHTHTHEYIYIYIYIRLAHIF